MSLGLWLILPYMAIAGVASAFVNRRTTTAIISGIAVLTLGLPFVVLALDNLSRSLGIAEFRLLLLLFLIGGSVMLGAIAVAASAFINGRTEPAIVAGIAALVLGLPFLVLALGHLNRNLGSVEFLIMLLSLLTGGGTLAVAFITYTNRALSKLRILYLIFIPLILLASFLFSILVKLAVTYVPEIPMFVVEFAEFTPFLIGVSILTGGGFLVAAFIAHSNMELHKKALYSIQLIFLVPFLLLLLATWSFAGGYLFAIEHTLWQLLRFLIIAGCIMMGINGVIYPNDPSIAPHKDSLELK